MNDKELFYEVLSRLSAAYPEQRLNIVDGLVERNGELIFNSNGFNLLYNLKRLCDSIEEELT